MIYSTTMTDCTKDDCTKYYAQASLPREAHENGSVFLENAWNIGRAYRNQALQLISLCQLLSRVAPPKLAYEYPELIRMRRVCDLALRSAADSGTKVTDETNARFKEATRMLGSHSERRHLLDLSLTVYSRMELAKWKDCAQRDRSYVEIVDECGPTMTINFVLLQSPLLAPHDPEVITVSQELSAGPSFSEILWNFSRYKDRGRITLEQNPHFYLGLPENKSAYTPKLQQHPLQDISGALRHNDTVHVLFDRPGRVFLEINHNLRIFGNVWALNGLLIFRDYSGVLEEEQLFRGPSTRSNLWHCEQPVLYQDSKPPSQPNYGCLRPIVTTPSADSSSEGRFQDWTVLSHPASHSINIHIYGPGRSPESTSTLDLPPPPTSQRPGYPVLYTNINTLNDDVLLGIFDFYRLDDRNKWNDGLAWRKLTHICRRWRHLIYSSVFHLDIHIQRTYRTAPIVDTLDHLSFLPLGIVYRNSNPRISEQDKLEAYRALLLPDRICSIELFLPPSALHKFFGLMNKTFPILKDLFLFSIPGASNEVANQVLPKTFLAPNLHSIALVRVDLPKRLSLLSSTVSLVKLHFVGIQAAGHLFLRQLVSRLRSLPRLEKLVIGFCEDMPRPSAEGEALGEQGTPVTLPSLNDLEFAGFSAYLECLVAQIRTPSLEYLAVTLFKQNSFTLPHLVHFTNTTEGLKLLRTGEVSFRPEGVYISMDQHRTLWDIGHFVLDVMCNGIDQQLSCAAEVCRALSPALSGVERLRLALGFGQTLEGLSSETDSTTWHELLRPFTAAKELRICPGLSEELTWALEEDDIGSDSGFLPHLQDLVSDLFWEDADAPFAWFIYDRRLAGRPVCLTFPRSIAPRARTQICSVESKSYERYYPKRKRRRV